jgi:two-component system nitrate/nitrite sensor histidine kinase NarX
MIVTRLTTDRQELLGFLLIGSLRLGAFLPRQFPLVQTTADQAVLLVENMQRMAELQVKTILEERNRLAREIHDGLAQTIGYLKLQVAQMQIYLERGEKDRLQEALMKTYQAISAAYQDARYAIDGLRTNPGNERLNDWLRQTVEDFHTNFAGGLTVSLELGDISARIPSEVQVQLIRIVQEALNNIRKHAQAQNIWVTFSMDDHDLILEIRDDGQGFQPEDITGPSRHGLQGMRERTDLIGASLQVVSQPAQGTKIVVRLPVSPREVVG